MDLGCESLNIASKRFTGCDKGMYAGANGLREDVELLISPSPGDQNSSCPDESTRQAATPDLVNLLCNHDDILRECKLGRADMITRCSTRYDRCRFSCTLEEIQGMRLVKALRRVKLLYTRRYEYPDSKDGRRMGDVEEEKRIVDRDQVDGQVRRVG
jgi:hypothetical protein